MAGLFDIFTNQNAQDAANAQIKGIQAGQNAATGAIDTGNQALTTNFMQALQPFQQNYGQAQGGVQQLLAALGIGQPGSSAAPGTGNMGAAPGAANTGPATALPAPGSTGATASPIESLLRATPGYQFQLGQGNENVLRNAARTGTTASGQTLNALQTQGQGLADTTYQQYVQNLQPFLGASGQSAGGIGNVFTGLGTGLNQNQNTLAQLGWTANTGIGNANANADLANNAASQNMWNAIMNGAKLGASVLSDETAKFDKRKIGELDDGQNIYSFRYKADPQRTHVGLMAQEVEKMKPDAVTEVGGVKFVDYGKATDTAAMFAAFLKAA